MHSGEGKIVSEREECLFCGLDEGLVVLFAAGRGTRTFEVLLQIFKLKS